MCGDARNWDEDAYRESILKEREIQTRTVFRTVWAPAQNPNPNPNPETIVAASSDGSIASYSISSCISKLQSFRNTKHNSNLLVAEPNCFVQGHDGPAYDIKFYGDGEDALLLSLLVAEPNCFVQGHDGPAYDIKFYGDGEDALLLSCGDDGRIRGWRWKDFTNSDVPIPLQAGKQMKPVLDLVNPQHKYRSLGALSPIPENNAIAVNIQETGKLKVVFKGHSDYLHCIVARNSANQIITGSEDGTARIWDCKSGKCIQVINPAENTKLKGFFSCVSCIALDGSESWLACSSGRCLSIWNLPASECISRTSTRASVQDVLFDDNQRSLGALSPIPENNAIAVNIQETGKLKVVFKGHSDYLHCIVARNSANQILAVGAEPLLCRFDINGAILSQIQCAPPSAFSVSLHPSGPCYISLKLSNSLFSLYTRGYSSWRLWRSCRCYLTVWKPPLHVPMKNLVQIQRHA
ncbi:tho complex subunit 6 [Quercus suber]|uniref:Tho complex subunit 6 n=1 Tax=Quercus suber TaxID=58331 RepID=A0AAW0KPN2_QUESU